MNQAPFIIASYALTIGGMAAVLLWSWWRMRRAEAKRDRL
ncbi:heme exporter protein CcmD [Sandaracinobacteroides saxicola]|uniref:Heme exporter protein D n=1 Tax=Sandaracinobacteroides saxicola TaxID=2759707 RepID=A0A7G5IL96_9SPHN|nr:heme exporter protein CcmD [Sandaracinobacteroides saxicola]QMW24138.1 heme exporter protein CcmD [Sandaracinobacteroides saxicola]